MIGADGDDVAASIAFTAVPEVAIVIGLLPLGPVFGMGAAAYGTFTGLTIYVVPQVIAAASPLGASAVQMGTLIKLVRVLMLGRSVLRSRRSRHTSPRRPSPPTR